MPPTTQDRLEADLRAARDSDDREAEARSLNALGAWHYSQLSFTAALVHYQQALDINRQIAHRVGEAALLTNIGHIHRLQTQPDRALSCYRASLDIRRELGDAMGAARTLADIAQTYLNDGQFAAAQQPLEEALAAYRTLHAEDETAHLEAAQQRLQARLDAGLGE